MAIILVGVGRSIILTGAASCPLRASLVCPVHHYTSVSTRMSHLVTIFATGCWIPLSLRIFCCCLLVHKHNPPKIPTPTRSGTIPLQFSKRIPTKSTSFHTSSRANTTKLILLVSFSSTYSCTYKHSSTCAGERAWSAPHPASCKQVGWSHLVVVGGWRQDDIFRRFACWGVVCRRIRRRFDERRGWQQSSWAVLCTIFIILPVRLIIISPPWHSSSTQQVGWWLHQSLKLEHLLLRKIKCLLAAMMLMIAVCYRRRCWCYCWRSCHLENWKSLYVIATRLLSMYGTSWCCPPRLRWSRGHDRRGGWWRPVMMLVLPLLGNKLPQWPDTPVQWKLARNLIV